MANFYNQATLTYNEATTPYDGEATAYTYTSAGITLGLVLSHAFENDGGFFTFLFAGQIPLGILVSHTHIRGFTRTPTIGGLTLRAVPNSVIVIRQYNKTTKDPVRTGGCPQCGTYLYNK
jgi:hypothetical protein